MLGFFFVNEVDERRRRLSGLRSFGCMVYGNLAEDGGD